MNKTNLIFLCVIFSITHNLSGQLVSPHKHFSPREFRAGKKVLCIDQSELGHLYLGTSTSLVKFDGERWMSGQIPGEKTIYWMDIDDDAKRIYVGSNGEFGYFNEHLVYTSISNKLDSIDADFGTIWELNVTTHGVYFRSSKYIFRFHKEELSIIEGKGESTTPFDIIFNVNDTIYTRIRGIGLAKIFDGNLKLLKGTPFDIKSNAFINHPNGLLIATRRDGLFIHDGSDVRVLKTEADDFFATHHIYHGTRLKNGDYAFATLTGGVIVINLNGEIVHKISKDNYGIHEGTGYVFEDSHQGLWIGMQVGTIRIDLQSPLSNYQIDELEDFITYTLYNEDLYLGTVNSLYALSEKSKPRKISDFPNLTENLFVVDDQLFASDLSDTYIIEEFNSRKVINPNSRSMTSIDHPDFDYVIGGQEGIFLIHYNRDAIWTVVEEITSAPKNVEKLITIDRSVFGVSSSSGLFKYNSDGVSIYDLKGVRNILEYDRKIIITASDGFFELDIAKDQITKSHNLNNLLPPDHSRVENIFIREDTTWILYYDQKKILTGEVYIGNRNIKTLPLFDVFQGDEPIIENTGNQLFIGSNKEIIKYDLHKALKLELPPLKVIINSSTFNGNKSKTDYTRDPIRFNFASNFIPSFGRNFYRYSIEGYNGDWSEWSSQNYMEITNLPEGNYKLIVEVITPYREFAESSFAFEILPPWHRTNWAYGAYTLLLGLIIWAFVKWRSRYLEIERKKLELLVLRRTAEISRQKTTIEESLEEREALLREIHHRVKNNLQVISSIFNMQLKEARTEEIRKLINDGQNRIKAMSLIHQKLYQSDNIKVISFQEYAKELVKQIESVYNKHCRITYHITGPNITLDADTAIPLGLILNELVSNSFKYAFDDEDKAAIGIHLDQSDYGFVLHYNDNGKGIPDEFNLESNNSLGLRLVKTLTKQLKGKLDISNHNGTHFEINFKPIT